MPFRTIPGTNTRYGLLCFDSLGAERQDDPDGVMSKRLLDLATSDNITNIFVFSHGWMGDVPAAYRQYDLWIKALDTLAPDRARAASVFPGFKPLYIGVHWPSLPWGDESLDGASFSVGQEPDPDEELSTYVGWLDDTPDVRDAVSTILEEAGADDELTPAVRAAFATIDTQLGLSASPDADGVTFDPRPGGMSQHASFGLTGGGALLDKLRVLSYWSMKKRARRIGEGAVHDFVRALLRETAAQATSIHLMGHSFGCVVISSTLGGPGGTSPLERPIDSVALVQGAVSLWSYAPSIPDSEDPGYFCNVVTSGKVRGPLITTRSRYDAAVNNPYRLASQVSGAASFEINDYPKFGAVGRFGLQGLSNDVAVDATLRAADEPYDFECGKIYNLEASTFISKMEGTSGAHNDIGGAEVAHAIWEAAFASARKP